jgi:hypothetical protein
MLSYFYRACLAATMLLPAAAHAQTPGCTDPLASNFDAAATQNDGSCIYPATTLSATTITELTDTIAETSGLLYWNGSFWTHNDDSDTTLYTIDTADGHITGRFRIAGAPNHDWEDLAQDDNYIYIGDFGNNVDGNRQDLAILRIAKSALLAAQSPITPDKIFFSYADQTSFAPTGNNNSDFDCEAFIATNDSLYLFSKQWLSGKTRLYALPKTPGTHTAVPRGEYNVDGLVAGATYLPSKRVIALTGYKIAGLSFQPFICLLYDYTGGNAFSGNKRKISVNPQYHQTEAIASTDGSRFFLTNEKLTNIITIKPRLQVLDLSPYLANWYGSLGVVPAKGAADSLTFYPNPAGNTFSTEVDARGAGKLRASLYNEAGQVIAEKDYSLKAGLNRISFERTADHPAGAYFVKLAWAGRTAWGRISLY